MAIPIYVNQSPNMHYNVAIEVDNWFFNSIFLCTHAPYFL
jgi:hypothetical protein